MFNLFNKPRKYPEVYAPYYNEFDFYNGREEWLASIESVPIKAVHLFSLHWLHLEVYNGGFWQYFFNSTSTSMPEAIDGFKAIGMPNVARVIESASEKLGSPFPFEKEARELIVGPPEEQMDFSEFDDEFWELADTDKIFRRVPKFVPFAEKYAEDS